MDLGIIALGALGAVLLVLALGVILDTLLLDAITRILRIEGRSFKKALLVVLISIPAVVIAASILELLMLTYLGWFIPDEYTEILSNVVFACTDFVVFTLLIRWKYDVTIQKSCAIAAIIAVVGLLFYLLLEYGSSFVMFGV